MIGRPGRIVRRPVGIYPIGGQAWLDMGQFDAMADMKRRLEEGE